MNIARVCGMAAALALIGLALVYLRSEQIRCGARLARMETEWVAYRRELWELQARTARLKAPQIVHERVDTLRTELIPPRDETLKQPPARVVAAPR